MLSIHDSISQILVKKAIETAKANIPIFGTTPGPADPSERRAPGKKEVELPPPKPSQEGPICIIGAGAAGLYTAMMLQDLGLDFVILEANETRIGGRMYTHRFSDKALNAPVNTPERYDYIDMGAMRYPHIAAHEPFFNLCKTVGVPLAKYIFNNPNTFTSYNRNTFHPEDVNKSPDVFRVGEKAGGFVPPTFLDETGGKYPNDGSAWVKPVMDPFVKALHEDPVKGWAKVSEFDPLSTRAFMSRTDPDKNRSNLDPAYPSYPPAVIEWLEMLSTGTGRWNGGFIESVLSAAEFGDMDALTTAGKQTYEARFDFKWSCVDGGSDRVIMGMLAYLGPNHQPILGKSVVGITPSEDRKTLMIQVRGESAPRQFSQVICTVPLGCLSSVDMTGCELSFTQNTAIRSLNYGPSTKVALKFKTRWWEDKVIMRGRPIVGGVTYTDLPVRMVVYPSYGLDCPPGSILPGVITASYCWAQDAARLGALAANGNAGAEITLMSIVRENLKTLHNVTDEQMGPTTSEDIKVEAWYNNPHSIGAFATFGPGSFGTTDATGATGFSMFASLKAPAAERRLHFAGEATSIHHGWVIGALNSAWRAVYSAVQWDEPLRIKLTTEPLKSRYPRPAEENLDQLRELGALGRSATI